MRPDAMRPRSRPERLRPRPNDLASRPQTSRRRRMLQVFRYGTPYSDGTCAAIYTIGRCLLRHIIRHGS